MLARIQMDLMNNPARGDVVSGLGGVRKARSANPARGKGKRGGYRYLFLYLEHRGHVHLLSLLDKSEQADLSEPQRKEIRRLVQQLKDA